MKLLVIIVTYNAMQWIDRCLSSVRNSSVENDVFIVDNGSTDGTQNYIKKNYPKVNFQQSPENLGFGRANNIGLQYAIDYNYDYVYLLNQDAWVMENTFQIMISAHLQNRKYGILSPIQMEANMHHMDKNFLKIFCSQGNSAVESLLLKKPLSIADNIHSMAAHWLISRECLEMVGGFSPAFYHYGEDDNYAERVEYHGLHVGVVLDAYAVHDREFRVMNIPKIIFFYYMASVVQASSLLNNNSQKHPILSFVKSNLKFVILYRSLLPFKYIMRYLCNYKTIKYYRKMSMQKGAFLNY